MTLVELAIGIAISGALGLVVVGLFKAGIVTYQYSMNQLISLTHSREALNGVGDYKGVSAAVRGAQSIKETLAAELAIVPPQGSSIRYYVENSKLYRSELEVPRLQAAGVKDLRIKYYGLDDAGRLKEEGASDSVVLVAAFLTLAGSPQDSVHFSGTALRNRP